MPANPSYSKSVPAEWTGARALMQTWLARRSARESLVNLFGGIFFLFLGIIALIFTSCAIAAVVFVILIEGNGLLAFFGLAVSLMRPALFAGLFLVFLALTILHAYVNRLDVDAPAKLNPDSYPGLGLLWEFISAGPVLLVLSGQEFHRHVRLSRMDVPQVSALLLWIYDKGGRASFAEISMAFPELNAVRVLPQLRDLPGINWWPDGAEVTFSGDLMKILAEALHREPKEAPFARTYTRERQQSQTPPVDAGPDILTWYATLNLPLFATLQDVKKRYRKLAKIHHPDVQSGDKIPNDDQMKRINDAYHNILRHSQNHAGPAL